VKNQLKTVGIIGKFDVMCRLDKGELITDMAYFSTTGKLFWNTKLKMDESLPEVIEFLLLHTVSDLDLSVCVSSLPHSNQNELFQKLWM